MTALCFTASSVISNKSMTGDPDVADYTLFENLPSEIIEIIGSYLDDLEDTAALCLTCKRMRAISMDKLRLYDPMIKISLSEISYLLRKWKIPTFKMTKDVTSKQVKDKANRGFYFDADELLQWVSDHPSKGMQTVYRNKKLFLRILNAKDFDPSTDCDLAIRLASENGHLEIVKRLLKDIRVDPSAVNNYAIRMASFFDHLEVLKVLLKDERVDPSKNSAFLYASRNGHLEVVNLLLEFERFYDDNYAIILASQNGHLEVVKRLLEDERFDPSYFDNYAIRMACERESLAVVELLLADKRVDPSAVDNYAIRFASCNGHFEIAQLLLKDERVDPSSNDNKAIRNASENGHSNIVKLLLGNQKLLLAQEDILQIRLKWSMNNEITELLQKYESRQKALKRDFNKANLK